jgi:hypothetical protein
VKLAVIYPDAEVATRVALTELLAAEDCTVAIGKPTDWTVESIPHVQVSLDGTPRIDHPVIAYSTLRITVWDHNPGPAKDLAALAMGLLLAEPYVSPLTGLLPARDPRSGADLASFTCRVATRSQPAPAGS